MNDDRNETSPTSPDSEPLGPADVVHGIRQDCDVGVWDNALTYADSINLGLADREECFAHGADWGAQWMAAIIGMGEAIRRSWSSDVDPGSDHNETNSR